MGNLKKKTSPFQLTQLNTERLPTSYPKRMQRRYRPGEVRGPSRPVVKNPNSSNCCSSFYGFCRDVYTEDCLMNMSPEMLSSTRTKGGSGRHTQHPGPSAPSTQPQSDQKKNHKKVSVVKVI